MQCPDRRVRGREDLRAGADARLAAFQLESVRPKRLTVIYQRRIDVAAGVSADRRDQRILWIPRGALHLVAHRRLDRLWVLLRVPRDRAGAGQFLDQRKQSVRRAQHAGGIREHLWTRHVDDCWIRDRLSHRPTRRRGDFSSHTERDRRAMDLVARDGIDCRIAIGRQLRRAVHRFRVGATTLVNRIVFGGRYRQLRVQTSDGDRADPVHLSRATRHSGLRRS